MELRAAGFGVNRVLFYHDGTAAGSDLFHIVLTMLDHHVQYDLAIQSAADATLPPSISHDLQAASRLDRPIGERRFVGSIETILPELASKPHYDLLIVPAASVEEVALKNVRIPIFLAAIPAIPMDPSKD
jgi:hypothetical protein